jgi:hypothetical protein
LSLLSSESRSMTSPFATAISRRIVPNNVTLLCIRMSVDKWIDCHPVRVWYSGEELDIQGSELKFEECVGVAESGKLSPRDIRLWT